MTTLHRALAVVILFVACTPTDARFNPSHFVLAGAGAPPDVALPADAKPGSMFGGLRTLAPTDEGFCCAAGPNLDLPVRKSGPATALIISVYLEKGWSTEHLRVTFPDGTARSVDIGKDGFSIIRIALPRALRTATGDMRVRVSANRAPYTLVSIYFV